MRTHEHAIVSVVYVFSSSLLFGSVCSDPYLYLVAVIGGEIIDFVDHPLNFLVYGRNQQHVLKSKEIFSHEYDKYLKNFLNSSGNKVFRPFEALFSRLSAVTLAMASTIKYLNAVEDRREIRGLLLHNVVVLIIMSWICLLISMFFSASVEMLILLGSFLLHMICDILGDIWTVGHFNNWLWNIPDRFRAIFQGRPRKFLIYALIVNLIVFSSFVIVSMRWSAQLSSEITNEGLFLVLFRQPNLIFILFLLGLVVYVSWLMLLLILLLRKYNLEFAQGRVVCFLKSVPNLLKWLFSSKGSNSFRDIYLEVRSDILSWVVFGSFLTAMTVILVDLLGLSNDFTIFFVPFFFSVVFGSMIHTSVGEFSGVFGVIIALLTNLILSDLGYREAWPTERAILLFVSAVAAWSMGLIGGLFFRGKEKMSFVVCNLKVCFDDITDEVFIRTFFDKLEKAIRNGYCLAHYLLQKDACNVVFDRSDPYALALSAGNLVAMTNSLHWRISTNYSPLLRELEYLFCDNLMVCNPKEANSGRPLPAMPKTRVWRPKYDPEMIHNDKAYEWYYRGEYLRFGTLAENIEGRMGKGLSKRGGEFLDNLVTLRVRIVTDLHITSQFNSISCTFLVREATSSKEYATVEAEVYLDAIIDEVRRILSADPVRMELFSSRVVFPDISIFDYEVIRDSAASFLYRKGFETDSLRMINRFVKLYSPTTSLSGILFGRIWSTAIELIIGSILGFASLYSTNIYDFFLKILGI